MPPAFPGLEIYGLITPGITLTLTPAGRYILTAILFYMFSGKNNILPEKIFFFL